VGPVIRGHDFRLPLHEARATGRIQAFIFAIQADTGRARQTDVLLVMDEGGNAGYVVVSSSHVRVPCAMNGRRPLFAL